ncbi:MAG: diacylglycerol kinase (ATP) [Granulosicoccus sp.]|jgi:diacylglycerol kinase (ATP)
MQKNTGLKRVVMAGVYSLKGFKAAFANEAAFRQELVLALIFIPVAFFTDVSGVARVLLICVTVLVLIVELLNSAVEAVVDRIGLEQNELSGRAKDLGSAAVLLSLLLWAYVWFELVVLGVWLNAG